MFDVFYYGNKPNLFAHEQPALFLEQAANMSRTKFFWFIYGGNDYTGFDFEFTPVPWEEHHVHVFPSQWQRCGDVFLANKHTVDQHVWNFRTEQKVRRLEDSSKWYIPDYVVPESIDCTWHPNSLDPAYIYHFETKWQWGNVGGPEYRVTGAVDDTYMDFMVADTKSDPANWMIPDWIDPTSIDWSWVPNPTEPPYIYEFAVEWGWDNIGGPEYHVPGATERKYVDFFVARTKPDATNFTLKDNVAADDDILRWRPNPAEPPYIYVFGNQWYPGEIRESACYTVPGATQIKFIDSLRAHRLPDQTNYTTLVECDFDYSWEPDPGDAPYIYVFGNQHWPAEIMPTVEYRVPGATNKKFMESPTAVLLPTANNWKTVVDIPFEFDYSWCPDPGDPAYNYVFGNQWYPAEEMPTVEYRMPGATETKYVDNHQARLLPVMDNWNVPEEVNASNIDFSWIPHPKDAPYIHHFGSEYQISTGLTYTVPGATEPKFEGDPPLLAKDKKAIDVLDIFFVDRMNSMASFRFEKLKELYPSIQKVRYANNMMATIQRCLTRAKTRKFWVISSENDYSDFDFAWHAEPWQNCMTHVFGSQWNKWSGTFLINKWEFERNAKWANGLEEFPNLNFVKNQTVRASDSNSNIFYVDWGNPESSLQLDRLKKKYPNIKVTRYVDNHLDTFKRIMSTASTEHVWIVSSICDYSRFDFSWQPEPWQSDMIHVFPTGFEKRGDTFYINVDMFKKQMVDLELLDWFNVINYCDEQTLPRWPVPHHYYNSDDLITEIKSYQFEYPYAIFSNSVDKHHFDMCLWSKKDRVVEGLTSSGSVSVVPRDVKSDLHAQIYDYPYVNTQKLGLLSDESLDIVYISNGEPDAEHWYNHLCAVLDKELPGFPTLKHDNRITRVSNVNGRAAAYKAAAEASRTPWFFAVFAKLEVDPEFDWDWQPDYWQEPKHYIFNARNPVNGLEYGHQAMIAYNKRLVLETEETGLDFTLSRAHEVVPILSGTAHFNQDPWMTWRTAFREVLKLKQFEEVNSTMESRHRLRTWLNKAEGEYAEWCLRGAQDAVEYYQSVNGDQAELMKSFDWAWLQDYFNQRYKNA